MSHGVVTVASGVVAWARPRAVLAVAAGGSAGGRLGRRRSSAVAWRAAASPVAAWRVAASQVAVAAAGAGGGVAGGGVAGGGDSAPEAASPAVARRPAARRVGGSECRRRSASSRSCRSARRRLRIVRRQRVLVLALGRPDAALRALGRRAVQLFLALLGQRRAAARDLGELPRAALQRAALAGLDRPVVAVREQDVGATIASRDGGRWRRRRGGSARPRTSSTRPS